jgi:hypothetical protein
MQKKFNRYDVTHLIHCLLARYKCKISMCRLRKLYPNTNYSTKVKFDYPIYAEACIAKLRDDLKTLGWVQSKALNNALEYQNATLDIWLCDSRYGDVEYSITPFIKS